MDVQKIKQFFYDKLLDAASYYGIFPEMEGGALPKNPKNLRLRSSFHNFKLKPVSDSRSVLTGELVAEILYEPGEPDSADFLLERILSVLSPENGAFSHEGLQILIGSISFPDQKAEGKYHRSSAIFSITVWENHES